jgi:hypothetical protein
MPQLTACVLFSLDELWLLQSVVRHEMAQQDQWKIPPVSAALNDQVADALVRCEEAGLGEVALVLTRADCLAIDYHVPQGAKSPSGVPIGRQLLMKSFRARRDIDEGLTLTADDPAQMTAEELAEQLRRWKESRRRKRRV